MDQIRMKALRRVHSMGRGTLAPFLVVALAILSLPGCSKPHSDILLATVGHSKLSLGEYEQSFLKNNGGVEAAQKASTADKEKFLDLLINYRLKVQEARDRGYADSADIRQEMKSYRKSLAMSFILDKEVTEPALKEMYDRRKTELRASHILVRLTPNASPEDTLAAYRKAMDIIGLLKSGQDFGTIARNMSDDPTAKNNSGDLYYFSSGMMVKPFEDACYALKKGEITSAPVRTAYGYHIIKITDRRPNVKAIRASHILIRFPNENPTPDDTLKAWNEIAAIADSIKAGADFGAMARAHSQDPGSAEQGGDLGFFERRRMVPQFDEAAFNLKVGEVSPIVRTRFGYHLIKVTGIDSIPPYAAMKDDLRRIYQRYRFSEDYRSYIETLKKRYGFATDSAGVSVLLALLDSTKTTSDSLWHLLPTSEQAHTPVFSFFTSGTSKQAAYTVDVGSILENLEQNQEFHNLKLTRENLRTIFDRLSETELINYRTRNIEAEYPEFAKLLREYEDGIILFKAQQEHIWKRIAPSDSALRAFYENHRSDYTFPDRVRFAEIFVATDSLARIVEDSLKHGVPFDTLVVRYTSRSGMKEKKGVWDLLPVTENDLTKKAWTMEIGEVSEPIKFLYGYSIIKVLEKAPARQKTYDEAVSEVASQFQEYRAKKLDEEWIQELRAKYPVKINEDALAKAFSNLKNSHSGKD